MDAYAVGKGNSGSFQRGRSGGRFSGQESIGDKRVFGMEHGMGLSLILYLHGPGPMKFGCLGRCTVCTLDKDDEVLVRMTLLFPTETPQILHHQIPYPLLIPAVAVQTSDLISSVS